MNTLSTKLPLDRGQCTMLIHSEWSGTALKAGVNRGYFSNGTTVYLYVMDKTNTANRDGFLIVFGNTYSATAPPAAPATLTVQ